MDYPKSTELPRLFSAAPSPSLSHEFNLSSGDAGPDATTNHSKSQNTTTYILPQINDKVSGTL